MTVHSIGASFLSHGQLGNHNAGEGGSQLSELKMKGDRPYISGQAFRHSVRDALRDITSEHVECSPADSCGRVSTCKICDLFGYFNSDLDVGENEEVPENKRWSPLRVTPLVGQYPAENITTDMILQFSPDENDHNIAYREMIENVYRGSWVVDATMVGRREVDHFDSDQSPGERYSREVVNEVDEGERQRRLQELLTSLKNACRLAGQARHMADFMPDLFIASLNEEYNQRITNALHVNPETRELEVRALESVVADLDAAGATVYMAGTYNPEVISNWDEVEQVARETNTITWTNSVEQAFQSIKEDVQ